MKKKKSLPKRQQSYLAKCIAYGAIGLLCFVNIRSTWPFMLIFLVLAVFYAFIWNKHKNDKSFIEVVKSVLKDDEYDKDGNVINEEEDEKLLEKKRKKSFQDYLAEVDKNFEDKELDEALANEEADDYDDEEYKDLFIR